MDSLPPDASRDQLTGWKEIASYVGKSVRTVQRWERRYAMPVHRVPGSADVVLASKQEIERWKRSEASLLAGFWADEDAERPRPDAAGPADATAARRASRRLRRTALLVLALVALPILGLLGLVFGRRLTDRSAALEHDETALFAGPSFALEWRSPGPYAFAALVPPPSSPRLRFTCVPARDARISHWIGFMANAGSARDQDAGAAPWIPKTGVALRLDRTDRAHEDSRAALWLFDAGEPRVLAPEQRLRFQFDPGGRYTCAITVEDRRMTARLSDGIHTEVLAATLGDRVTADAVFMATAGQDAGGRSLHGSDQPRFEELSVYDAQYKIDVVPGSSGRTGAITVVVISNLAVDALALDQGSLRLSGASVLPGPAGQGFACRPEQAGPDGIYDLACDFDARELARTPAGRELVLTGRTTYGRSVVGRLAAARLGGAARF